MDGGVRGASVLIYGFDFEAVLGGLRALRLTERFEGQVRAEVEEAVSKARRVLGEAESGRLAQSVSKRADGSIPVFARDRRGSLLPL